MSGKTVEITDANFEEVVLKSKVPVLLDFWAEWCGPCKMIGPSLEEMANEYDGRAIIGKINIDHNKSIPAEFKVRNIPTLLFFKDGEVQKKLLGAQPKSAYVSELEPLLGSSADNGSEAKVEATTVIDAPVEATDANFEELVLKSEIPVILDFWAAWCGPCKMIAPILDEIAKEFSGKVLIAKVNADNNSIVPSKYGIRNLPTILYLKNGEVVKKLIGAQSKSTFVNELEPLLGQTV